MPTLLVVVVVVLLLPNCISDSAQANDAELRALLAIKKDWGSPAALRSWKNSSASASSTTHCTWAGVACSSSGQVTAFSFQNFNIGRPIPASICSLKNLAYLDLSYNNLSGEFPAAALHGCSALRFLDLSNNIFSGVLPTDMDRLSPGTMEHLNLSSNSFSGSVPLAIAGFPKLKSLVVDTNGFNGSYPGAAIANLTRLETLTLANNPFAPGPIPDGFGKLTKLKLLWLSGMNLTHGIPDTLSSLSQLTVLALSDNSLQGEIPAWVWKLQKLELLYLYGNRFTGAIGPDVTAMNIQEIDISSNSLTGPIPESIGDLRNLTLLFLNFNNISGPIPSSVGLLPNLVDIRLFSNSLSGPLPPELGKHSPLANLEVSNNFLTGELPDTLCFNKKLYDVVVFNNSFSGAFPAGFGECNTVNNIMAYNNRFTGEFPGAVWSEFPALTTVMIQNNSFAGVLPAEVSSKITRIEIGNNRFSGAIPASATGLETFMADNNWFSHGLPEDMSKLASLIQLSLAGNQISGSIPASIRALERLNYLNLSGNQITGAIPAAAIGLLPVLSVLDLSNNKLDGEIPEDFNDLHLSHLNLSFNQLVGEVPTTLESPVFDAAFLGNPGLCARQGSGMLLQTCPHGGGHGSASARMIVVVLIATVSGVSAIGFVAVVGWFVLRRNRKSDSWKMIPFGTLSFSEQDIISNMSEENVIGRGGSGKVYRIHLGGHEARGHGGGAGHSTTTVAVKKIGNDVDGANHDKEFEAEARSLGGLLHGNIVRLLCCISSDDTRLLVYEYMENGSLDRWLHVHRRRGGGKRAAASGPLDWPTRLSIAIDVATGLSYMHHGLTSPVVHRDIKSSNILLDRGFRAKIADFGLARILARGGESEHVSAVCGTFGYIAPGDLITLLRLVRKKKKTRACLDGLT
jgi:kinase